MSKDSIEKILIGDWNIPVSLCSNCYNKSSGFKGNRGYLLAAIISEVLDDKQVETYYGAAIEKLIIDLHREECTVCFYAKNFGKDSFKILKSFGVEF